MIQNEVWPISKCNFAESVPWLYIEWRILTDKVKPRMLTLDLVYLIDDTQYTYPKYTKHQNFVIKRGFQNKVSRLRETELLFCFKWRIISLCIDKTNQNNRYIMTTSNEVSKLDVTFYIYCMTFNKFLRNSVGNSFILKVDDIEDGIS